ncbi:hypothetical protein KEM52_005231, partial [Ascosphaera acerosa]
MAFRLNEASIIRKVYEAVPPRDIPHVLAALPTVYLPRLLAFVARTTDETPHLEFNLRWIDALLRIHGRYLKENAGLFATELRAVQRVVDEVRDNLKRLTEQNHYALEYLLSKPVLAQSAASTMRIDDAVGREGEDADEVMGDEDEGSDEGEGDWVGP